MTKSAVAPRKTTSLKGEKRFNQAVLWIILALGTLTMIVPFWWMISTSFDGAVTVDDIPFPPRFYPLEPSLKNYQMAFTNVPMVKYIGNSLLVACGNMVVSIFSAICCGYSLSKVPFKGKNAILMLALSTMMVPGEVTMVARYFLFQKMGLANSYWAFWLPAFAYVFGTFFAKQYMDSIPDSLRESALMDGAGELRIALQIFMPLCGALVATLAVLLFLGSWNDFMWPLIILTSPKKYTLQVGVALFATNGGLSKQPGIRMASTCISIIPILIVYLFLQRYIVESIALSGVKQ